MTIIEIPPPPSVNGLFRNVRGRGRVKTPKYKAWIEEAGWALKGQRPVRVSGPYELQIVMPPTRGDLGNYEKAISDLLVAHHLVDDDKHCRHITIGRDPLATMTLVVVKSADTWEHISEPAGRVLSSMIKDAAE